MIALNVLLTIIFIFLIIVKIKGSPIISLLSVQLVYLLFSVIFTFLSVIHNNIEFNVFSTFVLVIGFIHSVVGHFILYNCKNKISKGVVNSIDLTIDYYE